MRLSLRPLTLAVLLTGFAGSAGAADLMDAYELARTSDPVLAAADSSRQAVGENTVQARSVLLPQISGSAGFSDTNVHGLDIGGVGIDGDASRNRNYGLRLDQSIYDHSQWTRLAASHLREDQADFDYKATADELVVRVALVYFNVLTQIETLASSRAEERSVKRQLDQAEKRLEVGLAPITDVHEARARYDTARANAITAAIDLEDAREALAEIIGQPLDNLRGLAADYVPTNDDLRSADEWVNIALERNPALLSRELGLAAAEKDISTARAGHLPTLSGGVTTGHSTSWDNFSSAIDPDYESSRNGNTVVGLSLNVPLFNGFRTTSQVRQSVDFRDIAADEMERQKRAVVRSTRNAQRSLTAGEAEVEARRLSVVSAQAAVEASEAGLEVGTRTIVDVLITQQALFNAQREYSRSRHLFLVNKLRLAQVAGTISIEDVEEVNRLLTADAEAALDVAIAD